MAQSELLQELTAMCTFCKNAFIRDESDKIFDTFTISDGTMTVPDAAENQYVWVKGSLFNDGIYQYPLTELTDETFKGAVWLMRIPQSFVDLANKIVEYKTSNYDALKSPYTSESFGGYSYTRNTANDDTSEFGAFESELLRYRKQRYI